MKYFKKYWHICYQIGVPFIFDVNKILHVLSLFCLFTDSAAVKSRPTFLQSIRLGTNLQSAALPEITVN